MYVAKRDGRKQPIMFDKITARVRKLCYGLNPLVDPDLKDSFFEKGNGLGDSNKNRYAWLLQLFFAYLQHIEY